MEAFKLPLIPKVQQLLSCFGVSFKSTLQVDVTSRLYVCDRIKIILSECLCGLKVS